MNRFVESLRQLLGAEPRRPSREDLTPEVVRIYDEKRQHKLTKEDLEANAAAHEKSAKRHKWRNRRWAVLIAVNLLFVLSFQLDVQLVEGSLTASRVLGFHMADLNAALQIMLAYKHVVLNLLIGTATVFLLWLLLGGRSFCSWVCPYHLVAELTEKIHLKLVDKKLIKGRSFHRGVRTVFYVIFALLAFATGYTVFETISPTGILSRAVIYGPTLALLWVLFLLLFEIFVSQRAWCRYVCPIGLTYGIVGSMSPVRVSYNMVDCKHEGDCRKVCLVPHVLDVTIRNRSTDIDVPLGADCTRCGLCVDVCPTNSLNFEFAGSKKLD
ncbi:NapH/MauN family ferredoxin-type protein [Pseudohaliea sp.]|uniref:NapH/MauN family ferredoxin-type protein n=1 Tax=Pseudohaliea sp. TaxID=2740289 RepID=UPI0032EBBF34